MVHRVLSIVALVAVLAAAQPAAPVEGQTADDRRQGYQGQVEVAVNDVDGFWV